MAQFKNPTTGVTVQQENRSVQDLANQGFTEQIGAPDAPVVEAPEAPKTPEIVNKTSLQENIQGSLDTSPNLQANEAFIQGVAKLAGGQPATAEQLAMKGKTLSEVITEFGIGEQFKGFGITEPEEVKEVKTSPVASAIDSLIATKTSTLGEEADIGAFQEAKNIANIAVEESRQAIADKNLIDAVTLEGISKDQPIPMIEIQRQQQQFTTDEYIDNLKMTQDHNNKLILARMAEGNFLEAQRINQQIASDNFEIEKLKIDRAVEQQRISENEAELLREDEQTEFNRAANGFIRILNPDELTGLKEDDLIRIGDKIYRKPQEKSRVTSGSNTNNGGGWTLDNATQLYAQYMNSDYSSSEALSRVKELTGYDIKETNYTSSNIPSDLKIEVIENIKSDEATLQKIIDAYPDISSSYINSLYGQYTKKPKDEKTGSDDMTDAEFNEWLNS